MLICCGRRDQKLVIRTGRVSGALFLSNSQQESVDFWPNLQPEVRHFLRRSEICDSLSHPKSAQPRVGNLAKNRRILVVNSPKIVLRIPCKNHDFLITFTTSRYAFGYTNFSENVLFRVDIEP